MMHGQKKHQNKTYSLKAVQIIGTEGYSAALKRVLTLN